MSFLGRKHYVKNRAQAGDTIVEVLICVAILGGVLGGAYAIANQNTRINLGNQDRLSATKVAEGQLELLKGYASQSPIQAIDIDGTFCMYLDTTTNPARPQIATTTSGDTKCRLSAASLATATEPSYAVAIEKEGGIETASTSAVQIGQKYTITVSWDSYNSSGRDNVTYSYGVYK